MKKEIQKMSLDEKIEIIRDYDFRDKSLMEKLGYCVERADVLADRYDDILKRETEDMTDEDFYETLLSIFLTIDPESLSDEDYKDFYRLGREHLPEIFSTE